MPIKDIGAVTNKDGKTVRVAWKKANGLLWKIYLQDEFQRWVLQKDIGFVRSADVIDYFNRKIKKGEVVKA